jgi:putative transposase
LVYHVLNRSVGRIKLFRHDKDYQAFERTLVEARARLPLDVLTYCVMPTHWHLVLRPAREGDLSAFMQWLTLTHAQRWRTSHGNVGYGPLYQGRFKSFVIEEDAHLETVLRYVERNPLRARLVDDARDWRWSALHRRSQGDTDPPLLSDWPIQRRRDWIKFVNQPQTAAEEEALKTSIHRSRPYGTPAWQERIATSLDLASCFRRPGRPKKPANA